MEVFNICIIGLLLYLRIFFSAWFALIAEHNVLSTRGNLDDHTRNPDKIRIMTPET